ncbi:glycosyltransferase [Bacillus sp. AFS076308]|uniref:glycosyltransferase family 2 protein n=1 Tax=unclassified Bacillus (in: firmicutes) TaxID=185979 RepID=UPI000BF6A701|nr:MULTISPECIES: glycosyltransferase family 2 protein [unclassified Bacillus (in: firmicutes)]PFN99441.1 glycosyltransferase [Bacillus sp. AFS076308]PGV55835.1 glycosyltransferase [Bacillus sp. AFS037270]
MKNIKYSIIVPVFNEEEVILQTYQRLITVMDSTDAPYELLFINDGSKDRTEEILIEIGITDARVKLINFSRNFGHQVAISAGMDYAQGEAVVIIDADLQDPPELILDMIEKWMEGYEVVYAKRLSRKGESFFKKKSASLFYRTLRSMTDIDIPLDTGDFRLMDRKVVQQMKGLREKNRFVRGMASWVGFRQTAIEYERDERAAGETKYPLKRMLKLSMDGITSFSYKPLKLASYAGGLLAITGLIYMFYVFYLKIFTEATIPGWSSLIIIQLFFSSFVLILLGVMGEYIGRIYDETKNRPLYIVRDQYGMDEIKSIRQEPITIKK